MTISQNRTGVRIPLPDIVLASITSFEDLSKSRIEPEGPGYQLLGVDQHGFGYFVLIRETAPSPEQWDDLAVLGIDESGQLILKPKAELDCPSFHPREHQDYIDGYLLYQQLQETDFWRHAGDLPRTGMEAIISEAGRAIAVALDGMHAARKEPQDPDRMMMAAIVAGYHLHRYQFFQNNAIAIKTGSRNQFASGKASKKARGHGSTAE